MLISIITINYNDAIGLERTIKSVMQQDFEDVEHIIIDGNSDDGSKSIIEKYKNHLSYSISAPDSGVYNAMNKGIKVAKGDFLYFLNSGDILNNNSVLTKVSMYFTKDFDIYYGNILLFKANNDKELREHPKVLSFDFFYQKTLAHQATFIRRTLFDSVFFYNEDLKIVSDWEFFICAICKYNIPYKYVDVIIAQYDDFQGISSVAENKERLYQERETILHKHFSLFLKDYKELHAQRGKLGTNRFKMLANLEAYTMPKKIMSLVLRILIKLYKRN